MTLQSISLISLAYVLFLPIALGASISLVFWTAYSLRWVAKTRWTHKTGIFRANTPRCTDLRDRILSE